MEVSMIIYKSVLLLLTSSQDWMDAIFSFSSFFRLLPPCSKFGTENKIQ